MNTNGTRSVEMAGGGREEETYETGTNDTDDGLGLVEVEGLSVVL